MPRKPLRQCAVNNCPNLVEKSGDIYCKDHMKNDKRIRDINYNKYFRKYDANKRYDTRWKKVRDIYISSHPFCEECIKENNFIKATLVHHIKPIEDGGEKYDFNNLESLCQTHHMLIHKRIEREKK